MSELKDEFAKVYPAIYEQVSMWVRRIYIIGFNIYACWWIAKQIHDKQFQSKENWILFLFMAAGMYFFTKDSKGLFFKIKKEKK